MRRVLVFLTVLLASLAATPVAAAQPWQMRRLPETVASGSPGSPTAPANTSPANTAPAATAPATVVTDYQDPLQAAPPVSRPRTPSCTVTAVQHVFANSYGQPYVGTLTPPADCAGRWTKVVLDWAGRSKGRQYDRLAGMWIGGAEVLRTSTPEPDPSGITWHFDRDVTEFSPLLHGPQPVVLDLGNVVNQTYTGSYDITVTITYYRADAAHPAPQQADTVIPLSANAQQVGWQDLGPGKNFHSTVTVPANTARLTAEVYARGGGPCEEFWWAGLPDELAARDPNHQLCGGGDYREVQVVIDGRPAAVVTPYPTIYTGGVNPFLWRPISAIDSIVTLPYTVDLTPFVGTLTDGRPHQVDLTRPQGAGDTWTLGGNLFATTDPGVSRVTGTVTSADIPQAVPQVSVSGTGLDATATAHLDRRWGTAGVLHTSAGTVPATASGRWTFDTTNTLRDNGNRQLTQFRVRGVYSGDGGGASDSRSSFEFPLQADQTAQITDDNNYRITATVHIGRTLRSEAAGRPTAFSDDRIDANATIARTNGQLTTADGASDEHWRGLADPGRCYERAIDTEHGWVTSDAVHDQPCGRP